METKKVVVEVESNLGSLKSQLREAQAEVSAMSEKFGATSVEAMNAAKAAARLKDTIGDAKAMTDAFNPDAKFKALTASLSGALNGFQAVEGAMGLFGAEGKEVQEMLLKVQSAMALAQGVDGLLEAKDAFKTFGAQASAALAKTTAGQWLLTAAQTAGAAAMKIVNAVMNANPILLIVTGITALVGAFYLLVNSQKAAEETTASLNKTLEKQQDIINRQSKQIDDFSKLDIANARARGASEEELTKIKSKSVDEQIALAYKNYISTQKTYDKITALRRKDQATAEEVLEAQKKEQASYDAWQSAKMNKNISDAEDAADKAESLREKQAEAEEKAAEKAKEKAKANAEERKRLANEEAAHQKQLADAAIAEQKRVYDESVRLNAERISKEDAQFKLQQELTSSEHDKEIEALVESYDAKFAIAEGNADLELLLAEQQKVEIAAIDKKYLDEKAAAEKAARDKEDQDAKDALKKKEANILQGVQMSIDALSAIADIAEVFAGQDKQRQKKAFNIRKAANIASATMDTYKGAASAYADTPGGPVIKGIASGIAVVVGFARVAAIAKTQFEGGASSGGGDSSIGGGSMGGGSPQPANFNVVGNSNTNQLVQGLQNAPIQAFVVGAHVTNAQALDRNRIATASI